MEKYAAKLRLTPSPTLPWLPKILLPLTLASPQPHAQVLLQPDRVQVVAHVGQRTEKKLLQAVNIFDVYAGDRLEAGKKSYSVSFLLQDPTQTLTDQAIDQVMQRLIQQFEKQAGALIRK